MAKRVAREFSLRRVVSGGQTGVDRAALEAAIELGIEHAGWCPRGRLAEDGPIPAHFQLTETASPLYHIRTEKNVIDSDATLILHRGPLTGGTLLTRRFARAHRRPHLEIDLDRPRETTEVVAWLAEERIQTLNVAGPRESTSPGIQAVAKTWLLALLAPAVRAS